MMTKLMIDEKYAKELDKAEIDHHKPTAGAMLGHVLSNLFIENIRLTQAGIYAKAQLSVSIYVKLHKGKLNISLKFRIYFLMKMRLYQVQLKNF